MRLQALSSSKTDTTRVFPVKAAPMSGVRPDSCCEPSMFAFAFERARTSVGCPFVAAAYNGELPSCLQMQKSAPSRTNSKQTYINRHESWGLVQNEHVVSASTATSLAAFSLQGCLVEQRCTEVSPRNHLEG